MLSYALAERLYLGARLGDRGVDVDGRRGDLLAEQDLAYRHASARSRRGSRVGVSCEERYVSQESCTLTTFGVEDSRKAFSGRRWNTINRCQQRINEGDTAGQEITKVSRCSEDEILDEL